MSLFDQIIAGKVQVTNLDSTEDNLDNVDTEGTEVEAGEGAEAEPETQVEDTTETTTETETTEEVETTTDSEGQELVEEADEIETDLLEVEADEEEIQQVEQEVEEAEEAAIATESFLANLFAAKYTGGLSAAHCELAHEHVTYIGRQIKMPAKDMPALDYGRESFATAGAIAMSTEGAIQSVKDFIMKIINGIVSGVKWLLGKGREIFNKMFDQLTKLRKYAADLKEKVENISTDTPKEAKYKSSKNKWLVCGENNDAVKLGTVVDAANIVKEGTTDLIKGWDANYTAKVATENTTIVDNILNEMEKNGEQAANVKVDTTSINSIGQTSKTIDIKKFDTAFPFKVTTKIDNPGVSGHFFGKASVVYPGNFVLVAFGDKDGNLNKIMTAKVNDKTLNSLNKQEVQVSRKSELLQALGTINSALDDCEKIRAMVEKMNPTIKKLESVINKFRMKYVTFTKKARDDRSYMESIKMIRNAVSTLKQQIYVLRKPGEETVKLALRSAYGVLSVINVQASLYGKGSGNSAESSEPLGLPNK